jgi:cytochrome c biogenesis protein ResB
VDSNLGPAALLELAAPGHDPLRVALMLSRDGAKAFSGQSTVAPGLLLHARIPLDPSVERPDAMELRILERGALLFVGRVSSGQTIELPGGRALRLHGLPFWVRLHGNHDPGLWLVYIGFALGLAGATLVYTVIRVDEWVVVTREGDQERVRLALKPQRFGPLFKERFERLVRAHGGQP